MLQSLIVDWALVVHTARIVIAVVVLGLIGRMLYAARAYLAWRAFAFYVLAITVMPLVVVLRFGWLGVDAHPLLLHALETVFLVGLSGGLFEHVRAEAHRFRDSQRLMEQWRRLSQLAEKRARDMEVLSGATARLVSSLNLKEVLQAVVDQARMLGEADAVAVYLAGEGDPTGSLAHAIASGVLSGRGPLPPPRPNGLTATTLRTGEPAFVSDTRAHPLYPPNVYPAMRALASLPLRLEGEVLGVMNVSYGQPHAFDDDEMRLLSALADAAALAVHNARLHEQIARLAVTDDLTGLANRRRFLEALRTEVQRARRYRRPLSLIMIDLDRLKAINDEVGHAAGDAMLRGVAECVRSSVRDTDLPARLGGDEFAVLLPETGPEAAHGIAERIRAAVAGFTTTFGGRTVRSTVSVGVVSRPAGELPDLPRLMHLADAALYEAKTAGRNTVAVGSGESLPF